MRWSCLAVPLRQYGVELSQTSQDVPNQATFVWSWVYISRFPDASVAYWHVTWNRMPLPKDWLTTIIVFGGSVAVSFRLKRFSMSFHAVVPCCLGATNYQPNAGRLLCLCYPSKTTHLSRRGDRYTIFERTGDRYTTRHCSGVPRAEMPKHKIALCFIRAIVH